MDASLNDRLLAEREEDWRDKLVPLMSLMLVAAAVFFAVMSVVELRAFYARVQHAPLEIAQDFTEFEERAAPGVAGGLDYLRFKAAVRLEADALQRRYHQATTTMLARVWTRQLGFLTGMILALVGAAFVLGRLREPRTRLSGEGGGAKAALDTASPGLVLATLGTVLMAITLVVPFGVETFDRTVYLGDRSGLPPPADPSVLMPPDPGPPPPLP